MIAATIGIGEAYGKLARYAAQTVREMTGLETVILDDKDFVKSGLPHPHHLKLRLFDLVEDETVMFFDSDMVCLNRWSPQRFIKANAVVAVVERPVPTIMRICEAWDIPWHEYFNAGLMILDRRCHQDWLREAERFVLTDKKFTEFDPYDQAALNITRYRLGVKLELLDRRYNWVGFGKGKLCFEVPVFMAHGLKDGDRFANIDFFEGQFRPPFNWHITIDEEEMCRLKNRTLRVKDRERKKSLQLNGDGTIGPPFYLGTGCYWFAHTQSGSSLLAIASQRELVEEFMKTKECAWESFKELRPVSADVAL